MPSRITNRLPVILLAPEERERKKGEELERKRLGIGIPQLLYIHALGNLAPLISWSRYASWIASVTKYDPSHGRVILVLTFLCLH
jgi:hypothetical protein